MNNKYVEVFFRKADITAILQENSVTEIFNLSGNYQIDYYEEITKYDKKNQKEEKIQLSSIFLHSLVIDIKHIINNLIILSNTSINCL